MLIVWEQNGISGQQLVSGAILKVDQYSDYVQAPVEAIPGALAGFRFDKSIIFLSNTSHHLD